MKYFEIIKNQGNIKKQTVDRENSVCIFAVNTNSGLFIQDNFKSENHQSFDYVYNNMKNRMNTMFGFNFLDCEVYDWSLKILKYEFTGRQNVMAKLCTKHNAKVKMVIEMPTGTENSINYHFESELNLSENEIVTSMKNRFQKHLKGKYNCLDFYKSVNSTFDTLIVRIPGNYVDKNKAKG